LENNVLRELKRYWIRPGTIALALIAADQVTKAVILRTLPVEGASLPVLGDWLRLTLVHNTGVAFGLFQGFPHVFTVTSILISIGAVFFYRYQLPHNQPWVQTSVGMIVGGAVGNIIDRVRQGYVVDFIHIAWFPGIFNIADAAITIGVGMLAGYLLLLGDTEPRRHPAPDDDNLLGELLGHDPQRGGRR
jgi:signal peptidase II